MLQPHTCSSSLKIHSDAATLLTAQGFVQFAMGGGPKTLLDVDTLNERLKPNGAMRMR